MVSDTDIKVILIVCRLEEGTSRWALERQAAERAAECALSHTDRRHARQLEAAHKVTPAREVRKVKPRAEPAVDIVAVAQTNNSIRRNVFWYLPWHEHNAKSSATCCRQRQQQPMA